MSSKNTKRVGKVALKKDKVSQPPSDRSNAAAPNDETQKTDPVNTQPIVSTDDKRIGSSDDGSEYLI